MKIKLISVLLALAMLMGSILTMASCNGNENETGVAPPTVTTESTGADETEAPTTDEIEDETNETGEVESAPNPDEIMYENGGDVKNAGHTWSANAFAGIENVINEDAAIEISADDLIAKLIAKTGDNAAKAGEVYKVNGELRLTSDTKYYGNLATVIATGGIVIDGVSELVIKELILKGNVTIKNSSDITFFKLDLQSDSDIGVSIDSATEDVAFKSCKVSAKDVAIASEADLLSVYQTYASADKGITSVGDDLAIQESYIVALSSGIVSSGASCTVRDNTVEVDADGIGIEFGKDSYNGLIALNVVKNAQKSIKVIEGFNCVVILNSVVRVIGENNTNLYVVENNLGGVIELRNNRYLLCDGNVFAADGKNHSIIDINNTEYNGNNMQDVDARLQYGANEELLPHTNKDLFVGMERQGKVRDISLTKNYNVNKYICSLAKDNDVVIVPPGAYTVSSALNIGKAHSNTVIYGYGVYHESLEYGLAAQIGSAVNVTIKGLTIGYAKQSSGQIHILDKLGKNQILVISAAGYDRDFGLSNTDVYSGSYTDIFWAGEKYNWKGIGGGYKVVEKRDDGTMVFEITATDAAKIYKSTGVGDVWACRMGGENKQSFYIANSQNILIQDCVTYGYAAALMFVGTGTNQNVELYRVHNTVHSGYEIDEETYNKYLALEKQYDVDLEIYVDEHGRYRGATPRVGSVDATHITGSSTGMNITSCLFESMCDDGSNQHGASSRLHKIVDNKDGTTTLTYKGTISETYYWYNQQYGRTTNGGTQTTNFSKGDKIFVYASNGKILCDTVCLTDYRTVDLDGSGGINSSDKYHQMTVNYTYQGQPTQLVYSCYLYEVKVATDSIEWATDPITGEKYAVALEGYNLADNNYAMTHKVLVDNVSRASAGFHVDNTLIQCTRSRGILVKTRDALIEHTTIRDINMTAILLSVETTWGENTVPKNITIRNNLFDNTGAGYGSEGNQTYAPIAIQGLGALSSSATVSETTLPCNNVLIEENKFTNISCNYDITISAAQNITIKNNIFDNHVKRVVPVSGMASKEYAGTAIMVQVSMNIEISDNTFAPLSEGNITKNVRATNYKGITGTDVTDKDGNLIFPGDLPY